MRFVETSYHGVSGVIRRGSDLFYVNQRKSVLSVSSAFLYPSNEVSFAFQMLIFKAV